MFLYRFATGAKKRPKKNNTGEREKRKEREFLMASRGQRANDEHESRRSCRTLGAHKASIAGVKKV